MTRRSSFAVVAAVLALCSVGCASDTPTTVLLRIEQGTLSEVPASLKIWVFGDSGRFVDGQAIPEEGSPELPGETVIYPKRSEDTLRILVRAYGSADAFLGEGVTTARLASGQQVKGLLLLASSALPDGDQDGVPDALDNCPDLDNPGQGPCDPDGGPSDGGHDIGPLDQGPDTVNCDEDGDGYRSTLCGGDDCNDKVKAINPGADESGPGSAVCTDGQDNDCDKLTDLGEAGCRQCTQDSECADTNPCTDDRCVKNVCENTVQLGKSCDDGNVCTENETCVSDGSCGGGTAVVCSGSAPACHVRTCDQSKGGCINVPGNDGQACDDGKACTQAECQSGSCITLPGSFCQIGGNCYNDGQTNADGCVCDPSQDPGAWSAPSNGCRISGKCYASGAIDPSGSGCRCVSSQSTTTFSASSSQCKVNGKCINSGEGIVCSTCQPTISRTSLSPLAACQNAIVLVAANSAYNGDLGGITGANSKCASSASAVGLSINPPAFLASSSTSASSLVNAALHGREVVNGRGQRLFASWSAMLTGTKQASYHLYAFDGTMVDEGTGAWSDADAWTGMDTTGAWVTGADCSGWTSTTGSGNVHECDTYNLLVTPELKSCATPHALLCVWVR